MEFIGLLNDLPPLPVTCGCRRKTPGSAYGDRAYGTPRNRLALRRRRIKDCLAAPRMPHGSGLGKVRWVVERTLSGIAQARRLKIRYDCLPAMHRALTLLQMARICCHILQCHF